MVRPLLPMGSAPRTMPMSAVRRRNLRQLRVFLRFRSLYRVPLTPEVVAMLGARYARKHPQEGCGSPGFADLPGSAPRRPIAGPMGTGTGTTPAATPAPRSRPALRPARQRIDTLSSTEVS
ncbi:MAG TPA: hypothetical protein VHN15_03925 [Thermoanaerobaculia bacterium]|nr:hypothetical protein [Thermoanaerobaculia bacterium]